MDRNYCGDSWCCVQNDPALKAVVTFTVVGGNTLTFENVRPESIGPSAENPGVVGVEFDEPFHDRLVHIPFVLWWEVKWV